VKWLAAWHWVGCPLLVRVKVDVQTAQVQRRVSLDQPP
jgi:hypothetical protein